MGYSYELKLPELITLRKSPSWINSGENGRLDRSACVEVRASEIKKLITSLESVITKPIPGSSRPNTITWCEAQGCVTINANWLEHMHSTRNLLQLIGDARGNRANAMKSPYTWRRGIKRPKLADGSPSQINPNKGVIFNNSKDPRSKTLGLQDNWTQTIKIQRWRLHENLARHFIICEGNGKLSAISSQLLALNTEVRSQRSEVSSQKPEPDCPQFRGSGSEYEAQCRGFRQHTNQFSVNKLLRPCLHRVAKLFLPLCTVEEARDADVAESFINRIYICFAAMGRDIPASLSDYLKLLIDRYGILFRGNGELSEVRKFQPLAPASGGGVLSYPKSEISQNPDAGSVSDPPRWDQREEPGTFSPLPPGEGKGEGSSSLLSTNSSLLTFPGRILLCRNCHDLRYGGHFRGKGTEYYRKREVRRKDLAGTLTLDDLNTQERQAVEFAESFHQEITAHNDFMQKMQDLMRVIKGG